MKNKKSLVMISLIALFSILTICLLTIDVKTFGGDNKEIGLYFINYVSTKITYREWLDKISDVFLLLSIAIIFVLGLMGFTQLVKRKKNLKVDREILSFGIALIVLVFLWFVFDNLIVINYRPILVNEKLEPSYPSTHVMIVTFVLLSSVSLLAKYTKIKNGIVGYIIAAILIITTCLLRILSGMHWITDCLGGLIIGSVLFYFYNILKSTDSR